MVDDALHERELREQWQGSHADLHKLSEEALIIARKDIERRLDDMNKFREQIAQERGEFLRRDFYDEQHTSLRDSMDTRLKLLEQSKSNLEGRMWMMGAGISAVVVVVNLIMKYAGTK